MLTVLLIFVAAGPALSASAADVPFRSLGDGAWCWFGDPRAVHYNGMYDRTYVGWIDQQGNVKVSSYDHASTASTTTVLHRALEVDDHDNPSLHVLPSGRVMAFYSRHGGEKMYYRVSDEPEDVASWRKERTIPTNTPGRRGYTYPNPVELGAAGNRLFLFWRGGNWNPTFSSSTDGGRTWRGAQTLIKARGERPYVKYASTEREIHFAFTQAHPNSRNTNIYYAYYRDGAFYRASGKRIGSMASLPLRPHETDRVYDASATSWIHDIALDPGGRPVVVFASFASSDRHFYHYARWTDGGWEQRRITFAGGSIAESGEQPYYSGGITLDHEDPSVVYLSREVQGVYEVEIWQTPDGGSTWTSEAVTAGSSVKNVRPFSPRGLVPLYEDMSVLWMRGRYETFRKYDTDLSAAMLDE